MATSQQINQKNAITANSNDAAQSEYNKAEVTLTILGQDKVIAEDDYLIYTIVAENFGPESAKHVYIRAKMDNFLEGEDTKITKRSCRYEDDKPCIDYTNKNLQWPHQWEANIAPEGGARISLIGKVKDRSLKTANIEAELVLFTPPNQKGTPVRNIALKTKDSRSTEIEESVKKVDKR